AEWAAKLGGTLLPNGSVRLGSFEGALTALEGFAEGEWWVQDAAASLPATLLGDIKGKRVADLCAAPGGKTAQLIMAGAKVTAFDINKNRL
ncbi:MFS transporter, partial [Ochrobactrum sp. SFR4]|nr:MFS transporter [Ochrobactrum sp. SFR4]